jgi:hypothetical protein
MGIELIRGRAFSAQDTRDRPHLVIIDEALARIPLPSEDPLDKRMSRNGPGSEIHHSLLKATSGSTFAARRAGR